MELSWEVVLVFLYMEDFELLQRIQYVFSRALLCKWSLDSLRSLNSVLIHYIVKQNHGTIMMSKLNHYISYVNPIYFASILQCHLSLFSCQHGLQSLRRD